MLMPILTAFWAAVAFSMYFIEFTQMHLRIAFRRNRIPLKPETWRPFNRKPFSCETCLPFWSFAIFLPFAIYRCDLVACFAAACTAGIITPLILKAIRR